MRRHAKAAVAVTVLLLTLVLGTSAATAAQVYVPVQTFSGPGSDPGQLSSPRRAAVEQATGNLFVADSGNGRVQVFDDEGNFLTAFGEAELDAPFGLAIRESGSETEVYVSDPATEQILRYDSDEQATPSFTVDAGFASPAAGAGQLKIGDFAAPLAVDPNNGDLWVGDAGDDRAQRYDSSGAFELANDGSDSPGGVFGGLLDLATDSAGRLYVVDSDGFITGQPDGTSASGQSRVERFSAAGAHQLTLTGLTRPATVAVDFATDRVAVSADQDSVDYNGEPSLHVFEAAGTKVDDLRMGASTQFATVQGLAWRSADQDVFSVNDVGYWNGVPLGTPSINRFELANEPTAMIDAVAAGSIGATEAEFTGTVNPEGHTTTARFEISNDGGASWRELEELSVCEVAAPGDCTSDEAVSFTATGLVPNVSYSVRLVAVSPVAEGASGVETFSTDEAPPLAITDRAERTSTSIVFNGRINPYGLATTYYFEYGTAPGSYTASVPVSEDADAGSGTGLLSVSQEATGLDPATTYYYRLVAANAEGSTSGEELAVTTMAAGQYLPDNYVEIGDFGKHNLGSGPEEFNEPRRLAVHEPSGQILVVDQSNARVQVFAPTATSATYLTEFGSGIFSSPYGIAVDQATGDVYVSDAGLNQVIKFNRTEGEPPSFAVDPTFSTPAQGAESGEVGSFSSALEVDPASGDLWVADSGNNRVQRYSSSGAFLGAFDGSDSPLGPFAGLNDIEVDSAGAIVVARGSHVERFGPGGKHQLTIGGDYFGQLDGVHVAVNSHDQILVATGYQDARIAIWENGTQVGQVQFPHTIYGWTGAAVDQQSGRLYALSGLHFGGCCGMNSVRVLVPAVRPAVAIAPIGTVGSTTVEVSGAVDPRGSATEWYFEYSEAGEDRWYPTPYPSESLGAGSSDVPVGHTIEGLQPNTAYDVRLVAESAGGRATTAVESFSTAKAPPSAAGIFAAPRTTTTARLNARINAHGEPSTYRFEYGTDTSYGSTVPATLDGEAGSDTSPVLVAEELTGLQPDTTYHYRVVTENSSGTAVGADHTFTTRTVTEMTPPGRGIELVNQPDKGGQDVKFPLVAPDDSGIFWQTIGGAPGSPLSISFFRSERSLDTPSGWSSESLLPPIDQLTPDSTYRTFPLAIAADARALLVGAIDASETLATVERASHNGVDLLETFEYRSIVPTPFHGTFANQGIAATGDLSKVFVNTSQPIDPEHVSPGGFGESGGRFNVYEIAGGEPELVSRMPNGSVPSCGVSIYGFAGFSTYYFQPRDNWISADGSKLLFASRGDDCGRYGGLFLRDLGAGTTTELSPPLAVLSRDPNDDSPSHIGLAGQAWPIGFADDGSEVLFITKAPVAEIDRNENADLYRWTVAGSSSCLTCATSAAIEAAVASDDLSRIYFTSRDRLTPGEGDNHSPDRLNLYRWHDGEIKYVAPLAWPSLGPAPWNEDERIELTPDGKVAVFANRAPGITADTAGCVGPDCRHLYRYDDESGEIECLDCSPGGDPVPGGLTVYALPNLPAPRLVSDDGSTVAFESNASLLPKDINGGGDIYQWRNGRLSLVTDGATQFASLEFAGMSADATDLYFTAGGPRLTGFEVDRSGQLYDARVGGGFPPPAPPAECVEDACQGPLEVAPPVQPTGSANFSGPGNARVDKPRKRCGKNRRAVKRGGKNRCVKKRRAAKTHRRKNNSTRGGAR